MQSMCGRYTLTIDKSTVEKRFGGKFYIAQASYDYEATYSHEVSLGAPHPWGLVRLLSNLLLRCRVAGSRRDLVHGSFG